MLYPDSTLEASRAMKGPLGVLTFVFLRALEESGAAAADLASVRALADAHLPGLSDHDCEVLVDVLATRLNEAAELGDWTESERLLGGLQRAEAHITRGALAQAGVPSRIRHLHSAGAHFPEATTGAELWVRLEDLEAAKAALEALSLDSEGLRVCAGCGEKSPASFARCWSCEAELSEASAPG